MLSAMTATALMLAAIIPAGSESTPPPGKITIEVVTVNGSGCPAGTAAVAPADDNTAFTVTYSQFLAQAGGVSQPTDFRKNCQLALQVSYPQGFTYGIAQADYRGFAHLASDAHGVEQANYYFAGHSPTAQRSHAFHGPMSDNWQAADRAETGSVVYAPCGERRLFNINTDLRVTASTAAAKKATNFISMDSTDASISTKYHFSWKKC
jgi:hypothetical protein